MNKIFKTIKLIVYNIPASFCFALGSLLVLVMIISDKISDFLIDLAVRLCTTTDMRMKIVDRCLKEVKQWENTNVK